MLTYDLQAGDQPKYYRLYTCIREDILRAELPPGQKLPSKRALAEHLHISLATVSGAYEQLVDEQLSGHYVSAISREVTRTRLLEKHYELRNAIANMLRSQPLRPRS